MREAVLHLTPVDAHLRLEQEFGMVLDDDQSPDSMKAVHKYDLEERKAVLKKELFGKAQAMPMLDIQEYVKPSWRRRQQFRHPSILPCPNEKRLPRRGMLSLQDIAMPFCS